MAKCLNNLLTGEKFYDSLHLKKASKIKNLDYNHAKVCNGASMTIYGLEEGDADSSDTHEENKAESIQDALTLIGECCDKNGMSEAAKSKRLAKVESQLKSIGTFELNTSELETAARMAWRNSPRCPGRIQWNNLELRDCRHVYDVETAFKVLCDHISYSTNRGNIKPCISIFPQRKVGQINHPIRIWNKFLISHAGYEVDGETIGDQANIAFTQMCEDLGWRGNGGNFDILPIVLSSASEGGKPRYFDIPEEIVLKVKIHHPRYPELSELGLMWYALPAVSCMSLNICSGVVFPATAFSGWYSLTEVAVRDMLDEQRYNLTTKLSHALNIGNNISNAFVKDRVATEMCDIVLHSFNVQGVSIVDHHTQSQQFMDFFRKEHDLRGGCPADWVWICPPVSGSLTEVFHQEMLNYLIRPCYNYQKSLEYKFAKHRKSAITLRILLIGMKFLGLLTVKMLKKRKKAMIFYASETGTARRFARELWNNLRMVCVNPILINLESTRPKDIRQCFRDDCVILSLFVVSTFGSGSSPGSVKDLEGELRSMMNWRQAPDETYGRYAVFALGSSTYPETFCAFGHVMDKALRLFGGQRILPMAKGDESGGRQLVTFEGWTNEVKGVLENLGCCSAQWQTELAWRTTKRSDSDVQNFAALHERDISKGCLVSKQYISDRVLLLTLDLSNSDLNLKSGDHLAVYPWNPKDIVKRVKKALKCSKEEEGPGHLVKDGVIHSPVATVEDMILKFYDISGPITPGFLKKLNIVGHEKKYLEYENLKVKPSKWRIFDLVHDLKINSKTLLNSLEPTRPRLYSLCNDPINNNVVELVVTLHKVDVDRELLGHCSQYFKSLKEGTDIFCSPHPSCIFDIALNRPDLPVLMVANGSGIAPFRAIWQSRKRMGTSPADTALLFGCRSEDCNLFASEEPDTHIRKTAFSRSKNVAKTYVQDLMNEDQDGERLFKNIVLDRGGCLLVCGSTLMAQGVKSAVASILQRHFGAEAGRESLHRLQREGKYQEEIFT